MTENLRKSVYNNNELGFVMLGCTNGIMWSGVIESIPFETIGKFIGGRSFGI